MGQEPGLPCPPSHFQRAWVPLQVEQEGVSVKGSPHFNPEPDAETLYKAMKGIGEWASEPRPRNAETLGLCLLRSKPLCSQPWGGGARNNLRVRVSPEPLRLTPSTQRITQAPPLPALVRTHSGDWRAGGRLRL